MRQFKILGITLLWISAFTITAPAHAKLDVLATTTDLAYIASRVAGDLGSVSSIAKGTQDPHYIEAKPSYMVKASKADLVLAVGLELEIGYLPNILRGARNPKIMPGNPGYLELGPQVNPLEIPRGKVTRAEGDVHPDGNPHFTLDPVRASDAAMLIARRMGELDSENAEQFAENAKTLQAELSEKTKQWQERIRKSGVKNIVSYHKTLTYFFNRFGLQNPAILEPKPGIPPTSGHILEVTRLIRSEKIPLILVENFFDPAVTRKIAQEVPSVRVVVVPVAVGGASEASTLPELYEALVRAVEGGAGR